MIRKRPLVASAVVALIGATGMIGGTATSAGAVASQATEHRQIPVCSGPPSGYAHCHAILNQVVTPDGKPGPNPSTPTGLNPSTYKQAYNWSSIGTGAGQTIALVDAYDDPTISSDLATFDSTFGLAPTSFTKVNENGGSSYPSADSSWSLEISLDVEWAHAIAPQANILLVEASTANFSDLMTAETYAASHAKFVSNSWGGNDFNGESFYDSDFSTAGVSYFASSGDSGGVVEYPSASPNVISVGGTTLTDNGGVWSESAWSSGGGGCSSYETANSTQVTGSISCGGNRATPDVAADANPNTGVAVYDTTSYSGQSGWFQVGGTSAASPVWAARSADQGSQVNAGYVYAGVSTSYPNATNISYRDVTSGSNGYSAGCGYDLATGLGSWIGGSSTSACAPPPTAPTNLTAQVNGSTVDLSWTGSNTATSYDVYRSSSSTGPFAQVGSTSAPTTTDTDSPTASGTYWYEVTAVNSGGASSAAGPVSATVTVTAKTMTVTVGAGAATKKGPKWQVPLTVYASANGTGLGGAGVALNVYSGNTCSGKVAASGTGTTGSNGQAAFNFSSSTAGQWCALATVTDTGYTTGSGQTIFNT